MYRWSLEVVQPDRISSAIAVSVENQAGMEKRSDVLSFETPPLQSPVSVVGATQVKVWVSSTAPESDTIVRLIDVYPNGYALILAEGQLRSTYREGPDRRVPAEPGRPYQLAIDLGPVGNLFARGHRIRLDITGSSFPRLEPLPAKSRNTIYHDRRRQSYLELPVTAQ